MPGRFTSQVNRYGGERAKVFNAGTYHSAFGDESFAMWVGAPGVKTSW